MNNPTVVPTVFHFHEAPVRNVFDDQGNPLWVAKDVCDVLGVINSRDALARVPNNHKGVEPIDTPGGIQMMNVVDEAGLYRLILRSDKPQAEPFMEWVTTEVLPAIRRTGSYADHATMGGAQVPSGMMLIPANEHMGALREIRDLLLQNNRMLQEKLEEAESRYRPRRNFTPEEDARVMELYAKGLSHRQIGKEIGRVPSSIRSCLRRLREVH